MRCTRGQLLLFAVLFATTTWASNVTTAPAPGSSSSTAAIPGGAEVSWRTFFFAFVVLAVVVTLMLGVAPVFALLSAAGFVLYLAGIITQAELFAGLVNNGVLSIAMLYVIVHPVVELPLMKRLIQVVIGGSSDGAMVMPGDSRHSPLARDGLVGSPEMSKVGVRARLRVCLLGMLTSSLLDNTPQTAMFTPLVTEHCHRVGLSPSQILMPMTFAILLANYFPLGFSVNLIVSGLMEEHGMGVLPLSELAKVNLPLAIPILVYLVYCPTYLLPTRRGGVSFYVRFLLSPESKFCGAKVAKALKHFFRHRTEASERVWIRRRQQRILGATTVFAEPFCRFLQLSPRDDITIVGLVSTLAYHSASTAQSEKNGQSSGVALFERRLFEIMECAISTRNSPLADEAQCSRHLELARRLCADEGIMLASLRVSLEGGDLGADRGARQACPNLAVQTSRCIADRGGQQDIDLDGMGEGEATALNGIPAATPPPAEAVVRADDSTQVHDWAKWHVANGGRMFTFTVPWWFPAGDFVTSAEADPPPHQSEATTDRSCAAEPTQAPRGLAPSSVVESLEVDDMPSSASVLRGEVRETNDRSARVLAASQSAATNTADDITSSPICDDPLAAVFAPSSPTLPLRCKVLRLPWWYAYTSLLIFAGVVVASFFGVHLCISCFAACCICVMSRLVSIQQLLHALPIEVYLLVAFSFPLGSGMQNSGLAADIGKAMLAADVTGIKLTYLVGIVTAALANMITSQGSVQVLFPLVVQAYEAQGLAPLPGIMTMLSMLSVALCTPFAIPPNAIILLPGGYVPMDYVKFGAPLTALVLLLLGLVVHALYY